MLTMSTTTATTTLLILILTLITITTIPRSLAIGVNWGTQSSHPLPPLKVVQLLKANNITKVKLSEADPLALEALSGSGIRVAVGIPNGILKMLNSSKKAAQSWVHDNVTRYFNGGSSSSGVKIEYIVVGDDPFLQSHGERFHPFVLGAATNLEAALMKANLAGEIKVVVPCSFDAFQSELGLPSKGHFRQDINKTMIELLTFLKKHHSPFFATISPFLSFCQTKNVSLDFALFRETARPHKDGRRTYKNSFDLSYDTLATALYSAGFPQMDIIVAKTGWPTDGAVNATPSIAEVFMKGLIKNLHSKMGTPLRPRRPPTETYLFSLLDEDQRNITTGGYERHWGIFTFDGQAKYHVNLGQRTRNLVNARNIEYLPQRWCVVNNNKDLYNASVAAKEACATADCTPVSPGGSCHIGWPGNISYAFNSYYQLHDQRAGSCDFGGLGLITSVDPSIDKCRFPIELQISFSAFLYKDYLFLRITLPLAISLLYLLIFIR